MSTRRRGATLVVAVVLTASGAGLAMTGTAQAAPAPAPVPSPIPSAEPEPQPEPQPLPATTPYGSSSVVAVTAGNVHTGPSSNDRVVSHVVRNNSYPAECWIEGDPVVFQGVSRRNWVRLQLVRGGTGYVNAIYLKGNDRANVTYHC
ncbi:MAG TPA: SH3 domain-containing protein [Pseudonocardia sp.]|uniref:SH3 domain-containing protein n=1 Tax=Pseudonocardia sp. TaxID=60912 RepID=UPI002D048BED|nr:SH3 domain-containing protein [Pseudonocardia sp.]HTF50238.1 SH3 domain-containing protein [Pseudonocardia sp.]